MLKSNKFSSGEINKATLNKVFYIGIFISSKGFRLNLTTTSVEIQNIISLLKETTVQFVIRHAMSICSKFISYKLTYIAFNKVFIVFKC